MKTPQVKPDWAYGIYTGSYKAPIVPTFDHCKQCGDLFIGLADEYSCDKCKED